MLSYALAIAVAISSLILFSTAFFMSKIHRQDDFLWSAVGLFYALILWFCARNITGTVLLGQAAATVLITSYCWQTIKLRQIIANPEKAKASKKTNSFSVVSKVKSLFKRQPQLESPAEPVVKPPTPKVTEQEITIPETPVDNQAKATETDGGNVVEPDHKSEQQSAKAEIANESETSDALTTPDAPVTSTSVAPSPPLPNKLPETATSPQPQSGENPESQTPVATSAVPPVTQVDELVTEAAAAVNPTSPTPEIANPETVVQPHAESTSETITPESVKPKSDLDLLEVVEVAEVLEAEAETKSERGNSDQDNIIEVTTTEIEVTTETQQVDRPPANNTDV